MDIKPSIIKDIKESFDSYVSIPEEELMYLVFKNAYSYGLTKEGLNLLKRLYDFYEFKYTDNIELETKHYVSLGTKMHYPYYLGRTRFVLFNKLDAFFLKLHGNDLKKWLDKSN